MPTNLADLLPATKAGQDRAFALDQSAARLRSPTGAIRTASSAVPTFSAGIASLAPAATPGDVFVFRTINYGRAPSVRRITLWGGADTAATINVLFQRSPEGGLGTYVEAAIARHDQRDAAPTGTLYGCTANRTGGNATGVSSSRPIIRSGKMTFGTASNPGQPFVVEFPADKAPRISELSQWFVLNLMGQTLPAGAWLSCDVTWVEEALPRVAFTGDSTTSNAIFMFQQLGTSGQLNSVANVENDGDNGKRLLDYLNATPGAVPGNCPQSYVLGRAPAVLPFCYGINDVRQGATSRAQLISMIDAAIYATLNGTTAGATYTSPKGAGTTFTWPNNIPANPDCRIILWGPNSFTTDGNAGNFVALTGLFAGMTLAQAAQEATNILYDAYEAFRGDPRIFALLQKQDLFGRICTTIANSGNAAYAAGKTKTAAPLMTDILHPNERGQVLSARQIAPVLADAIEDWRANVM